MATTTPASLTSGGLSRHFMLVHLASGRARLTMAPSGALVLPGVHRVEVVDGGAKLVSGVITGTKSLTTTGLVAGARVRASRVVTAAAGGSSQGEVANDDAAADIIEWKDVKRMAKHEEKYHHPHEPPYTGDLEGFRKSIKLAKELIATIEQENHFSGTKAEVLDVAAKRFHRLFLETEHGYVKAITVSLAAMTLLCIRGIVLEKVSEIPLSKFEVPPLPLEDPVEYYQRMNDDLASLVDSVTEAYGEYRTSITG